MFLENFTRINAILRDLTGGEGFRGEGGAKNADLEGNVENSRFKNDKSYQKSPRKH